MLDNIVVILKGILQAVAAGGLAGLMGYMKQEELGQSWKVIFTKEFWSKFEPDKAMKTMIVSAIVYGFAYGLGMTPTTIEGMGVYTLIVYGADALVKFIVRRTPLVKAWNYIKEKFQAVFGK